VRLTKGVVRLTERVVRLVKGVVRVAAPYMVADIQNQPMGSIIPLSHMYYILVLQLRGNNTR